MTDDTLDQDMLRDLAARTAQLPRDIDPPARAWSAIEAAIRSPVETASWSEPRAAHIAFWQKPAFLAAAAFLLVAGSSAITAIAIGRRPPLEPQQAIASADAVNAALEPVSLGETDSASDTPDNRSEPRAGQRSPVRSEGSQPTVATAPPASLAGSSAASTALAEFTMIENDYIGTVNRLSAMLDSDQMQLSPRTLAKMKESLRVIDAAILEARRALAEDPANKQLVEILSTTYGQKIDFLRRTTEMGRS